MRRAIGLFAFVFLVACQDTSVPTTPSGSPSTIQPPLIASLTATPQNGLMALQVSASDPALSPLTFTWMAGQGDLSSTSSPAIFWRPPAAPGLYTVSVSVTDAQGLTSTASQQFQMSADGSVVPSGPPHITQGSNSSSVPAGVQNASAPPVTPLAGAFALPTPRSPGATPFKPAFASPLPSPSAVSLAPSPSASAVSPTPQPGVPLPPPSRWVQIPPQSIPTSATLNQVFFEAPAYTEGWVVGANSTVLHSLNGGTTWQAIGGLPPNINFVQVFFTSQAQGFLAGDDNVVLRTGDGGVTWQAISPTALSPAPVNLSALLVANAQIVTISNAIGQVFQTQSANAASPSSVFWTQMDSRPPARPSDNCSTLLAGALFAPAPTLAYFVGDSVYRMNTSPPTPAQDWNRIYQFGASDGFGTAMSANTSNDLWVGTNVGEVLHSTDAGATWITLKNFTNRFWNGGPTTFTMGAIGDFAFPDPTHGYILSQYSNHVFDTNDGGATWAQTDLPQPLRAIQVQKQTSNGKTQYFGWGVGPQGVILKYAPN
jgi:photosystem II stability/assembly factor-like uncharacterized protein